MYGKLVTACAALTTASLVLATPALAEDCFNASRSAQGNASAAANSGVWWGVPEILSQLAGLTDAQIARAMPVINSDPRVPAGFTVFYNPAHPGELAHDMPARLATNHRGIDHSDNYATPVFDAIFEDVAIALG